MKTKRKVVVSRITAWFSERAYGFLSAGGEEDEENTSGYFLHGHDIISGTPMKGAVVRFELVVRKKGSAAVNAEIFQSRQEMERADAVSALADSTASATPTTDASAEVSRGE